MTTTPTTLLVPQSIDAIRSRDALERDAASTKKADEAEEEDGGKEEEEVEEVGKGVKEVEAMKEKKKEMTKEAELMERNNSGTSQTSIDSGIGDDDDHTTAVLCAV